MRTISQLPLEDEAVDVIQKAQRGLKLSDADLRDRAGITAHELSALSDNTLEKLAFVLNLHAPSLIAMAHKKWQPKLLPTINGFAMFTTAFSDMTVNAYLIWDPHTKQAASFDTGSNCQPMLDCIMQNKLSLQRIFITHTHLDHLADIQRLQVEHPNATGYGPAIENPLGLKPLNHHDGLILGNLSIRVLGTHGHTPGGLSYFIQGLAQPIVIVGDALFASSMGGAPLAWAQALNNNRKYLLSLPPQTIIAPGHGPCTTVAEEQAHNPFFPELK